MTAGEYVMIGVAIGLCAGGPLGMCALALYMGMIWESHRRVLKRARRLLNRHTLDKRR